MTVRLSPELEEMVQQDIAGGAYASMDEFVARAVTELHERELWFAEHREELRAKVEEGWASVDRGELYSAEEARAKVQQKLKERFGVRDVA